MPTFDAEERRVVLDLVVNEIARLNAAHVDPDGQAVLGRAARKLRQADDAALLAVGAVCPGFGGALTVYTRARLQDGERAVPVCPDCAERLGSDLIVRAREAEREGEADEQAEYAGREGHRDS